KGERQRDNKTGRFTPAPKEGERPSESDQGKPETEYSKATKDAERYDRNWQKLNEDQARIRQREEEIAQREAELQAGMEGRHPTRATKEGFTADDYDQAA